ncbi:MAG: tetratricopeptide repeat protein, partial [Acidobacteriaceae bacterium]
AIAASVFFLASPCQCEDKKDAPLLYSKAVASYHDGNFVSAIDGFKQVVALSPNHPIAWNDLGRAYLALNRNAEAIAAFEQQIKVNPNSIFAYNNLGLALEYEKRYGEAEDAFKRQLQFSPHDRWAHGNLARVALMRHEYELAARELQSVIEITPKDANAYVSLAELYLQIGRPERAIPEMDRAIELSATPHIWNNLAYLLAKHDLQLDRAQRYSESAVQSVEARLRTMEVRTLTRSDVDSVDTLAADWDTLGLIHFKRSHFATAEAYISAAWTLTQSGTAAFHLGQVYEAEKRLDDAKLMYACAQNSHEIVTDLRPLLNGLVSSQSEEQQLRVKCSDKVEEARHITLGSSSKEKGEAKIIVGVGSDSTITGARWISGGLSLEAAKDALKSFDFSFVFPSPPPPRFF